MKGIITVLGVILIVVSLFIAYIIYSVVYANSIGSRESFCGGFLVIWAIVLGILGCILKKIGIL